MLLRIMAAHPLAESCEGSGEGRNLEREGLQRSVTPRFIVGREEGEVHTVEQVIIRHIQDSVVAVEIGRNEIHLDLALRTIVQSDLTKTTCDIVVLRVHQHVGGHRAVVGLFAGKTGHKRFVGTVVTGRYHNESLYAATFIVGTVQAVESIDENIYALVLPLVTATYADQNGVFRHSLTGHGRSNTDESFPGLRPFLRIFLLGWGETVLESVRSHDIDRTAEELAALIGRNFAYRRKDVGILCGLLLKGVSCHHIEFTGFRSRIITFQSVVQRQVVACYATSEHGCVGREDCGNRKVCALDVEQSGSGHPLVELGYDLV